jgi:low affinity Fe/Cu permease
VRAWFDRLSCAVAAAVGGPYTLVSFALIVAALFVLLSVEQVNIVISLLTLALLPILQASQNRDGAALQAKLDESIRAVPQAKDELRHLDERTIDEVQEVRKDD